MVHTNESINTTNYYNDSLMGGIIWECSTKTIKDLEIGGKKYW